MKRIFLNILVFSSLLAFLPMCVQGQYYCWHYDKLIENNAGHAGNSPSIAISGSKAVAVWCQSDGTTDRIYANFSINGGKTWHADRLIEDNAGAMAYSPQVALSGNLAVAAWYQSYNGYYRVFSNYSTDGGATWHADQMIQDETGEDAEYPIQPSVSLSGARAVVVWSQKENSYLYRLYANYSTNGGKSWHSRQAIDKSYPTGSHEATVSLSGLNAVAVWRQDNGTYIQACSNYSADGGATWHTQQRLDDVTDDVEELQVAISGTNAVAVWHKHLAVGSDIRSNYSTDGGATWHADQQIKASGTGYVGAPRLAMSGNRVVAVWREFTELSLTQRVIANYSTDGGASWAWPFALMPDNGISAENPQVALSGANAMVVWLQSDGSVNRIFFNYSTAGGAGWNPARMIDGIVGPAASNPVVAISGTKVVAAWTADDGTTTRIVSNYAGNSLKQKYLLLPPKLNGPANGMVSVALPVTLSWQDTNTDPQELKYRIRIKPAGGTYTTAVVPANSISFLKSGLRPGKTYFWNVQAVGNGTSIITSPWANGGVNWKFTTQ